MGTKDLTHEALSKALSENAPLSLEQRGVLISAIANDKRWQRIFDAETERLNATIIQLRAVLDEQRKLGVPGLLRWLGHIPVVHSVWAELTICLRV